MSTHTSSSGSRLTGMPISTSAMPLTAQLGQAVAHIHDIFQRSDPWAHCLSCSTIRRKGSPSQDTCGCTDGSAPHKENNIIHNEPESVQARFAARRSVHCCTSGTCPAYPAVPDQTLNQAIYIPSSFIHGSLYIAACSPVS
jgi:hypothetical protein